MRYRLVSTRAGFVGFVMSQRGLRRIILPLDSKEEVHRAIARDEPDAIEDTQLAPGLADELVRYFAGGEVTFSPQLDLTGRGPFDCAVWKACRKVGYGETASYADLARRVGKPAAARAVGMAMGRNPFPIVVPCHRIVRSDGSLGGYSGRQGLVFKRRLLEMEAAAATPM